MTTTEETASGSQSVAGFIQATPTLAALLKVAIADLEQVAADGRYELRMNVWHRPGTTIKPSCQVCLAGAVIARSLNGSPQEELTPLDFPEEIAARLDALNYMRMGRMEVAGRAFYRVPDYCPQLPLSLRHALQSRADRETGPLRELVAWLEAQQL
jgi:hypothetical protein